MGRQVGDGLLFAEPMGPVKAALFEDELRDVERAGLIHTARPSIRWSRAALLKTV